MLIWDFLNIFCIYGIVRNCMISIFSYMKSVWQAFLINPGGRGGALVREDGAGRWWGRMGRPHFLPSSILVAKIFHRVQHQKFSEGAFGTDITKFEGERAENTQFFGQICLSAQSTSFLACFFFNFACRAENFWQNSVLKYFRRALKIKLIVLKKGRQNFHTRPYLMFICVFGLCQKLRIFLTSGLNQETPGSYLKIKSSSKCRLTISRAKNNPRNITVTKKQNNKHFHTSDRC